ncbi:MAG: hypothetical protein IJO29_01235 [Oscillospiraceae bacterium]|nr:hypothetical protein [Oscillospiraceae bacterium]
MKMIIKRATLGFVIAILPTAIGCAKAPDEVLSEISNFEDGNAVESVEVVTMPLEEVILQAENISTNNTTNISFDNLILPNSISMPSYRVDFYNEKTSDLFEQLTTESFLGNDGTGISIDIESRVDEWLNNEDYCFTAYPSLSEKCYYRNESDIIISDGGYYFGQTIRMTETGCITYWDSDSTEFDSHSKFPVVKRYYNDFEKAEETYTLSDGSSKSASDIVYFAENFCNSTIKQAENNTFDYQVNYIDVRDLGNGKFGYYVSLCRNDIYGNRFDATTMYPFGYNEFAEKNALIAAPTYMWITSSESITLFEKGSSFSLEETGVNEKIVSLESAVDLLSATLAQGKSYDFDTVELKYVFEISQSDYIDAAREFALDEENDAISSTCYSPDSVYAYGDYEIIANPYWVFTDASAQKTSTNGGGMYMINALDGSFRIENVNEQGNVILNY